MPESLFPVGNAWSLFPWDSVLGERGACEEQLRLGIGLRELERLETNLRRGAEKGLNKRNSRVRALRRAAPAPPPRVFPLQRPLHSRPQVYYEALELRDLLAAEGAAQSDDDDDDDGARMQQMWQMAQQHKQREGQE